MLRGGAPSSGERGTEPGRRPVPLVLAAAALSGTVARGADIPDGPGLQTPEVQTL
jgi:hypothetical protein